MLPNLVLPRIDVGSSSSSTQNQPLCHRSSSIIPNNKISKDVHVSWSRTTLGAIISYHGRWRTYLRIHLPAGHAHSQLCTALIKCKILRLYIARLVNIALLIFYKGRLTAITNFIYSLLNCVWGTLVCNVINYIYILCTLPIVPYIYIYKNNVKKKTVYVYTYIYVYTVFFFTVFLDV